VVCVWIHISGPLYFFLFSSNLHFLHWYSQMAVHMTVNTYTIALVEITARVILSPKWNVSLITTSLSLSLSRFQERGILCIHTPSDIPERYTTLSRLYKQKRSCIRVRACILYIYVTRRQRTSPPSSATSPPRSPRDTPRASPARTPRQCYSNECSFSWATTATTTSKSI